MIDLFMSIIRHPGDYLPLLRRHTIYLTQHYNDDGEVHTFVFRLTSPFSWQAGQKAIFTLPDTQIQGKNWQTYKVASSACEGVIQIDITTNSEPSDFERKLLRLRHDDPVHIYGPYGEFHARINTKHIIGVAMGMGIASFRALAYEISRHHLPNTRLTLIYTANSTYVHKAELDAWQNQHFRVVYTHSARETEYALATAFYLHDTKADYYVAGASVAITSIRDYAKKIGVKHITCDSFERYTQ